MNNNAKVATFLVFFVIWVVQELVYALNVRHCSFLQLSLAWIRLA